MTPLVRSVLRGALGLGLFAVFTAGLIALTQALTHDRIVEQRRQAQAGALLEILPAGSHDNNLLDGGFTIPPSPELGLEQAATGYRASKNGQVTAVILPVVAPEGYSGPIRLLVGVNRAGVLAGVRVLEHHETPGLGDHIELKKSDWLLDFNGKSLTQPEPRFWKVKKDGGVFDQFTGATITPRAVVKAVHRALLYVHQHGDRLFDGHEARNLKE